MVFQIEESNKFKSELLNKVAEIRERLQREVEDYYWEKEIDSEDDEIQMLQIIRRYLIEADREIEIMLEDLDKRL